MDDETRRAVDEACLRLLGYTQCGSLPSLWFGPTDSVTVGRDGPSQNEHHVVRLAKALRVLGWHVSVNSCWLSDQWAAQLLHGGREVTECADTMEGALAMAAAKAVGEAQER